MSFRFRKSSWYVIACKPGDEAKVRADINRNARINMLGDSIDQFLIPIRMLMGIKKGKRCLTRRTRFPGYLFIKMKFDDRVVEMVKRTRRVFGFLPYFDPDLFDEERPADYNSYGEPRPLSEKEVQYLTAIDSNNGTEVVTNFLPYTVGDRVLVKDGTFTGQTGPITEIIPGVDPRVKVELMMLGSKVPVELDHWLLELES